MFDLYLLKRVALPTDNSRTARFIPDSTLIPHLTCLISSNTLCIEIDIHDDIYVQSVSHDVGGEANSRSRTTAVLLLDTGAEKASDFFTLGPKNRKKIGRCHIRSKLASASQQ